MTFLSLKFKYRLIIQKPHLLDKFLRKKKFNKISILRPFKNYSFFYSIKKNTVLNKGLESFDISIIFRSKRAGILNRGGRITSIGETMLGFVGGSPNRPGRGHCAEEWERFPLPAKFPPYSQSALPDQCNSLSSPPSCTLRETIQTRCSTMTDPAFAQHHETTVSLLHLQINKVSYFSILYT